MTLRRVLPLAVLFWVAIAEYLAQIPYYLMNYYIPHHMAPTLSSLILLGSSLAWFMIGYFGLRAHRRFDYWVLLSFLLVEGLFYLRTLMFGAVRFQLDNPSLVIRTVSLVGYATGIVSLICVVVLIVFHARHQGTRRSPT